MSVPEPGRPQAHAVIDAFRGPHAWLSNFSAYPAAYDGATYPTAEHAFAAAKTLDRAERGRIAAARTPADAKRLGRAVTLRPGWDDIRLQVAEQILASKFSDPALARLLEQTGDALLVEGNTWGDTFWGVCRGRGENHLGRLLMELRSRQRDARCAPPGAGADRGATRGGGHGRTA